MNKLTKKYELEIFDNPDEFYKEHEQNLNFFKKIVFKAIVRKLMNKNINKIRDNKN
jgi:hypothetical protein